MSTAKQRAEIYCTKRWRRLRWAALERDGFLCAVCKAKGLTELAQTVHHVIEVEAGGAIWDIDNLASMCARCHNEIHHTRDATHPEIVAWRNLVHATHWRLFNMRKSQTLTVELSEKREKVNGIIGAHRHVERAADRTGRHHQAPTRN